MVRASPVQRGVSIRQVEALPPVVGVLGYGVDGQAVVQWLQGHAAVDRVLVFDDREVKLPGGSSKVTRGSSLADVGLLFRSPGVKVGHPLLLEAGRRGIPVTSSTRWFLRHTASRTVGITGSNGKTTCSVLIARMLAAQFGEEAVAEGGNDREPRLDLLSGQKSEARDQFAVLELSSFQLIDSDVSPSVAVVLNITPNHLDWHAGMEEYAEAKRQIVAHQGRGDTAVLNPRDPRVREFARDLRSTVRWFDEGVPSSAVLCRTHPDTVRAAVTAARVLQVSEERIAEVLRTFGGVPQRLELVREFAGVRFYNDSSCTTPESAIVACQTFPVGTVVLLLGGRDKGMDYSRLYDVIREHRVRVVPYGEMAPVFQRSIPTSYQLPATSSFVNVITAAHRIAMEDDNIVLSPACTSFDMFRNAKERGRRFEEIVRELRE